MKKKADKPNVTVNVNIFSNITLDGKANLQNSKAYIKLSMNQALMFLKTPRLKIIHLLHANHKLLGLLSFVLQEYFVFLL